ncbi:DNA-processing protein DprA [Alicyclobacillus dauci]|uniref:DNA-processing protein DprA n=1 Tax=Alicyclobacillus dauci TaxID=1475485 RepID=A0ABY6YZ70_9BACL|nr:DNA-processing protein DprA [Alicyclobacillus dauci]WAH35421.1 DNA-processing protein DprA [Alicyclobacillus dauci]
MTDERMLRIYWAMCPGLEPSSYRRMFQHFGAAQALHGASEGEWLKASRLHKETVQRMVDWQRRPEKDVIATVDRLHETGAVSIVQGDSSYPDSLYPLYDPPVVLFARGDVKLLRATRIVSVVGTRRASSYGLEVTRWVSTRLAQAGFTVCSGLALGIDARAQGAALDSDGSSVAVLGCGVDICYPPGNRWLYERLLSDGLVISEYQPQGSVMKYHFPERNRIIAALSGATIVVQAGEKSGALGTAMSALELGRDVYVVPGPITSKSFRGSHRLLLDGAIPLIDPEEFIAQFTGSATDDCVESDYQNIPQHLRALANLLIEEGPLRAGELAQLSASPPGHIYAALLELELGSLARRLPDGRYEFRQEN